MNATTLTRRARLASARTSTPEETTVPLTTYATAIGAILAAGGRILSVQADRTEAVILWQAPR